jgi:glycosyltransferase involved in cell wall biosynthesis
MRLVVDLQSCQPQARDCGPGRRSLWLAQSIARQAGGHEIWLALSDRFPETIPVIRHEFDGLVAKDHIAVFSVAGPLAENQSANLWRARAAEKIREHFLATLKPDIVFVPWLLDGWESDVIASIGAFERSGQTATLLPDLAPLLAQRADPSDVCLRGFHCRKLQSLRNADLLLATSERSRQEALAILGFPEDAVVCVAEAADHECFQSPAIENLASRIWEVFASRHEAHRERERGSMAVLQRKPRLAFVSPLPPERTGIADYSAELVGELARFYEITLIVDQPTIDNVYLAASFPTRSVTWFQENGDGFDCVLYQMGNSPFHKHMFGLLQRHPGVAVLHDSFLGDCLHWMEATGFASQFFHRSLYASHGYPALLALKRQGARETKRIYPCNKPVFDDAIGVVVHSQYAIDAAQRCYGDRVASRIVRIPQLHRLPPSHNREGAREVLGIGANDLLVCSFGILNSSKLNHRLLDSWLASSLIDDGRCHLVFVGEIEPGNYGESLLEKTRSVPARGRVEIAGRVDATRYQEYLEAADFVVQLRTTSRGETSRSMLDALACGLPLIINAHGPAAEYPDDVLVKLPDEFTDAALARALERLRQDAALRDQLGKAARRYTAQFHNPRAVAEDFHRAIEHFAAQSDVARRRALVESIASIAAPVEPSAADLEATAESIARNTPEPRQRQLLVDISVLAKHDLRTGIERVARGVLLQFLRNPPAGLRVEPVRCERGIFRYARQFAVEMLGIDKTGLEDERIDVQLNDVFVGLDVDYAEIFQNPAVLQGYAALGVGIFFVVYDILPVERPEFFPPDCSAGFVRWLETAVAVADGLVCISRATVGSLRQWLEAHPPRRVDPLQLGHFHQGADMANSAPTGGLPETAAEVLDHLKQTTTFLMVGTVEPRKGHAQTLLAFEELWSKNVDVNLVVVGKEGWKNVESDSRKKIVEIVGRMRGHPELGKRLFWLEGISDEYLELVYAASTCLIAASEAEGFGLPLIEAAQHELPIIARDIPVFREVAGEHAFFFAGLQPGALAEAVKTWMGLREKGQVPPSGQMPRLTWEASARRLAEVIINDKWDSTYPLPRREGF